MREKGERMKEKGRTKREIKKSKIKIDTNICLVYFC
jgi:hypothetical protein